MRKQNPTHRYRSMSAGSSRGYHLLLGQSPAESSHRRTRSEFQPPTAELLFEQSSGLGLRGPKDDNNGSSSLNYNSVAGGSKVGSYQQNSNLKNNQVSDVRRRR
ncbi:hypothetical protein V6N11_072555 [Hibiscus sabdariffa]|uniref:Uncharacterized protein n=1 Tax=Hibiscus sabdariffa TaxID=183260 RepID=A0ABR2U3P0_9ROSI